MTDKIFVGFSTIGSTNNRSWALYDIELIKRDLLNHFHTRLGERVMRPTFGCAIWDYLFEQLTPSIVEKVETEVHRIISLDTRVEVVSLTVDSSDHGIICIADLLYHPFDIVDRFRIEFDARQ